MNDEIEQLLIDIRRIGPTYAPPTPKVLFGELFDDEQVEQYYEALVGTLKCAKKRGMVHFKGQMLLKGIHDKVTITIREDGVEIDEKDADDAASLAGTPRSFRMSGTPRSWAPTPSSTTSWMATPRSFTTPGSCTPKSFALMTPLSALSSTSAPPRTFSYQKKKKVSKSPIVETPKSQIVGTCSDTEGPRNNENEKEARPLSIATDSELDVLACPRRVVIPVAFRATDTVVRVGLPPRKARSPRWRSNIVPKPRRPLLVKRWSEQELLVAAEKEKAEQSPPPPTLKLPPKKLAPSHRAKSDPRLPPHVVRSQRNLSSEVATQVQDEVLQLLVDIRRVGANPGEPTVKFGELFDDEVVQNTYEALVGTLRSAKRQGLIDFKGQMLLKGMHDHVEISVVEQ